MKLRKAGEALGLSTVRAVLKLLGVGVCTTGDGTYRGPRGLDIWFWLGNKQCLHKVLGFNQKNKCHCQHCLLQNLFNLSVTYY